MPLQHKTDFQELKSFPTSLQVVAIPTHEEHFILGTDFAIGGE